MLLCNFRFCTKQVNISDQSNWTSWNYNECNWMLELCYKAQIYHHKECFCVLKPQQQETKAGCLEACLLIALTVEAMLVFIHTKKIGRTAISTSKVSTNWELCHSLTNQLAPSQLTYLQCGTEQSGMDITIAVMLH